MKTIYFLTGLFFVQLISNAQNVTKLKSFTIPNYVSPDGNMVDYKGSLYFVAYDQTAGYELHKCNGTAESIQVVKDITTGINANNGPGPSNLTVSQNMLFFSAAEVFLANNGSPQHLWKSDGTEQGTVKVKSTGTIPTLPTNFYDAGNLLYFLSNNMVWRTDGTDVGTFPITTYPAMNVQGQFWKLGNKVFFVVYTQETGNELWVTDGTVNGTKIVKDIEAGAGSSSINSGFAFNGYLYFNNYNSTYGSEIWRTDGTESGTELFVDLNPGSGSSNVKIYGVSKGNLIFYGSDENGTSLWKTDGLTKTAQKIALPNTSFDYTFGNGLKTECNDKVFFQAYNEGNKLFVSDGSDVGTYLVSDKLDKPYKLISVNNKVYGRTYQGDIFYTDGTDAGTYVMSVENDQWGNKVQTDYLTNSNGTCYFTSVNGTSLSLWKVNDNSVSSTKLIFENNLEIFPNPVCKKLNFANKQKGYLNVVNLTGQIILQKYIEENCEIDISDLKNDIYFVTLKTSDKYYASKIIVKN